MVFVLCRKKPGERKGHGRGGPRKGRGIEGEGHGRGGAQKGRGMEGEGHRRGGAWKGQGQGDKQRSLSCLNKE